MAPHPQIEAAARHATCVADGHAARARHAERALLDVALVGALGRLLVQLEPDALAQRALAQPVAAKERQVHGTQCAHARPRRAD
eukprot:179281-Pleurochrysis_carterae.AAC.1